MLTYLLAMSRVEEGCSKAMLPVYFSCTVFDATEDVVVVEVLLCVHRNRRLIRDGSPGRPPRLSHSS